MTTEEAYKELAKALVEEFYEEELESRREDPEAYEDPEEQAMASETALWLANDLKHKRDRAGVIQKLRGALLEYAEELEAKEQANGPGSSES